MEKVKLLYRILSEQFSVKGQFPGDGQGMLPSLSDGGSVSVTFFLRDPRPTDQNAPSPAVRKCLGGIEIKAMIQFAECFWMTCVIGIFQCEVLTQEIPGLIKILIPFGFCRKALRAAQQEPLSVHFKQIRAFPHIAECFFGSHFFQQEPYFFVG